MPIGDNFDWKFRNFQYITIRCFASIASRIGWTVYVFTALHFHAGAPLESDIYFLVFTSPPRTAQTATRNVFQKRVKMSPPPFVTAPQVNYILLFCFDHYYDRSLYILFSRHCASFVLNHHPDVPRFTFFRHSSSVIADSRANIHFNIAPSARPKTKNDVSINIYKRLS